MTREKSHRAELQRGLLAGLCALAACTPDAGLLPQAPAKGPISIGTPDRGWRTVDCAAAEAALEFAPFPIANFEQSNNEEGYIGQFMYSYTDDTATGVYANRDGTPALFGFEPIATSANVCSSDTTNHVLHVTGGPYLGWGGGIGVAMEHIGQSDGGYGLGLCQVGQPPQHDFCLPSGVEDAVAMTTLDMSKWDGVAVWARRGPDSQPLLRVLVGNKYTDDDVSFLQYGADPTKPRYCERARECACVNGKAGTVSSQTGQTSNTCGVTRCDEPYPAYAQMYADPSRYKDENGNPDLVRSLSVGTDPQFYKRPCTPYAFRNGIQSSYCFDPARDPPPAESDQQCGDYWTFPLHLTTEWQLFLVPFTIMYQQGWAKRWPFFDTASVSVVRLTWDAGWIDYWIDNLRFYRVRR